MEENYSALNTSTFTIAAVAVAIVIIFLFLFWKQSQNRRLLRGHHLCEFMNKAGQSYVMILPITNGEITAPKEHNVRGGSYFTHTDYQFDTLYPPGAWLKMLEVPCKKTYFVEGNPEPVNPFASEALVTSKLIQTSKDEKFSELLLATATEIYEKLERMVKSLTLNPTLLYLLAGGALATGAAAAYLSYQNMMQIKYLMEAAGMIAK